MCLTEPRCLLSVHVRPSWPRSTPVHPVSCEGLLANIPALEQAKSRSDPTVNAPLVSFLEPCRETFDICEQASSVRSRNVRDKLSTNESDPASPLQIPRSRSELNPQRKLSDAVSAGVAEARGENLSECALAVSTLSQILARIIEVWVIGEIGKAAFELDHDSLRDPEVLSEPQGEVNGSGADKRSHAGVAKAASSR